MMEAAKRYYDAGLTPLPVAYKEKRALVEGWPRMSREELYYTFSKYDGCNIGIRLDNLTIIDIERPELWGLIFKSSPTEIAKHTWVSRTGRGYHVYLRGETSPLRADGFAEIRSGPKQYVVAPPSIHPSGRPYEWVSDITSTSISTSKNLEKVKKKIDILQRNSALINEFIEVWRPEHRHNLALFLSGYFAISGFPKVEAEIIIKTICLLSRDPEIKDRLRALEDSYNKPRENLKGYSGLVEELYSIVGPEKASGILKLLPRPIEERGGEREKTCIVSGGEILGGRLVEVVENDGSLKLLVYDLSMDSFEINDVLKIGNAEYKPYMDLPFKAYLPNIPRDINQDSELWFNTLDFIREYYDNPKSNDVYHLMTAVVAWSYFCNNVRGSTPYLCFLGPFRSGKTRALEIMAALCYKPLFMVDPSEASMFRVIEKLKPTLIIDETQIINQNVRAILAAGYRYGIKVPRVIDPEADDLEAIRWFDVFGLKIYACREEPPSDILSRSVIIHCEKNVRQTKKRIDEVMAKELRTRWLAQKLRMFSKIIITFEEFQSEDGRLQELFSPLLVMAQYFGGPEAQAAIERYGRHVEKEVMAMETTSDDGEIISAVFEYIESKPGDAPTVIPIQDLTDILNRGLPKPEYEPRYVGKRMAALGFQRIRLTGGKRAYVIDYELLNRLARRYGINTSIEPPLVT